MMISDSLQVALIAEKLEADSPQRRRAASILLDLSQSGQMSDLADSNVNVVGQTAGTAVAAEARSLLEKFGICNRSEHSSSSGPS